ncbi:MAG: polyprenyl diphosphate synthase [Nanoarchaeota archaeon]
MKQLDFVIKGRVQGIRFRKLVENFVKYNNLKGFVENFEDGSVRGILQGEKENVDDFISWVESNPGFSKITNFVKKISDVKNDKEEIKDFEIRKNNNFFVDKFKAVSNLFKSFGEEEELNVPNHIAIIPDGNRRWAKERGMEGFRGHEKAGEVDSLISLFEETRNLGVRYISFWGFSTENWKRDKEENDKLFNVLLKGVEEFLKYAHENKVRFRHLGRKDRFSKELVDALEKLESETEKYSDYNVNLCLDYGGRDEILRAVNKLLNAKAKNINEEQFTKVLDTNGVPEPDLILRTSGEKRLSGFMPWQGVYAELLFVEKHFPDFKPQDVREAVEEFSRRKRRFGGN